MSEWALALLGLYLGGMLATCIFELIVFANDLKRSVPGTVLLVILGTLFWPITLFITFGVANNLMRIRERQAWESLDYEHWDEE